MEKIIKNCKGVKRCNDGINRMEKTNQKDNFRMLLRFKKKRQISNQRTVSFIKHSSSIFI